MKKKKMSLEEARAYWSTLEKRKTHPKKNTKKIEQDYHKKEGHSRRNASERKQTDPIKQKIYNLRKEIRMLEKKIEMDDLTSEEELNYLNKIGELEEELNRLLEKKTQN